MNEQSIALYNTTGSANKVYKASVDEVDGGFLVNIAYGGIGKTLRTGTKTQKPVDAIKAQAIYDKLVKSKISDGYRPDEAVESDCVTELDSRQTDTLPQLLNVVDEADIPGLLKTESFGLQEKHDGERMLTHIKDGGITAINKKGLTRGLAKSIAESLTDVPYNTIVDGEVMGDHFYVFDVLEASGNDCRRLPYYARLEILESLVFGNHVSVVKTVTDPAEKKAYFEQLKSEKAEGAVFKYMNSYYVQGRPSSGGDQLKAKFYKALSVIVSDHNEQRSVKVAVIDSGKQVLIGNVTIPPNADGGPNAVNGVPPIGSVVEVRYLNCRRGGSLYQPTYLGFRNDTDVDECLIGQIVYKRDE